MTAPLASAEQTGFTLIEMLVVLAIIAITLGVTMLKVGVSDGQRLSLAAENLSARLEAARDEAVISGQTIAFSSDGKGIQFWVADTEHNAWVALPNSDTLTSGQLPDGVTLTHIRVNGLTRPLGDRLKFSASGLNDAFSLILAAGEASTLINGDILGRIEVSRAQ